MAGLDLTSFDFALKEYYTDEKVEDLVYQDNPWLAIVPKREDFYGDVLPIPLIFGNPQGRSHTFSNAQANKQPTAGRKFNLTRQQDYGLADIDNETLLASQNNKGSWLEARTNEIDGVINALSRSLGINLFRDQGGSIGRTGAISTVTVTLLDTTGSGIEEITNFEINMELSAGPNKNGTSLRAGSATVTALNRSLGTLTSDSNWTAQITSFAVNDYLFVQGDPTQALSGLDDWIPAAAPTGGDNFFGVDRSVDTNRLAGIRVTATNQPLEEALIEGASQCAREGGSPDICFMDFEKFSELEKALGSKVHLIEVQATANIMFPGIQINGPKGPIKVIPDRNCQPSVAWMLTSKVWKLYSLGKAPRVLNTDGLQMLRLSTSDGVEVRWGYYANLGCHAPGWNARIILET